MSKPNYSVESALVALGFLVLAEVVNECVGYKLIEVEIPKGRKGK